jgi:hypothetical protein
VRVSSATRHYHRPGFVYFATAEKQISNFRFNLNDFFRELAMRFAMNLHRSFGAWRLAKAKDFAGALVHPVLVIVDAVFALHLDVVGVRLGHVVRGDPSRNLVNIHVGWHTQ